MDYFVGLDLSLNGTAIVIVDQNKNLILNRVISTNPKNGIEDRIRQITDKVINELYNISDNLSSIYIEGISYGSTGKAFSQLSGLFYHIQILIDNNFPNVIKKIIAPGTLKKYITGKGNAKKDLILLNVYKKFGIEFDNSDSADAFSLAMLSLEENSYGVCKNV